MEKNRSIAHTIIDLVENAIRTAHPEIEQFVPKTDKEGNVINTFLYGEDYYNLEDSVVQVLNDNQEDTD